MSCSVGYPTKPCPFDHEGRVTRASCGACKHYTPPQHILRWCLLWDRERVLCMKPIKDCEPCPEKSETGRPKVIDWADPVAVAAYYKEKSERWRRENPDAAKTSAVEAMARFLQKDPDYFRKYREANREKMNEAVRRHRQKRRASGTGDGQS